MSKDYRGRVSPVTSATGDKYMALMAQIVIQHPASLGTIAQRGEVGRSTIANWLSGKTKRPQRETMDRVLHACGYRMGVLPKNSTFSEELKPIKSFNWSVKR